MVNQSALPTLLHQGCQVALWRSMNKISGFHTPTLSRMLQAWDCKERWFYTACHHRECTGEKANLPENMSVAAQEEGAGGEEHLWFPTWILEGTSSTLWWPELSQTAAATEEKRLDSAGIYWNRSLKTLTVCWGSLRSWKSDKVGEERSACWGSLDTGEGYLCVVILYQGCPGMQRQLLKQVTVMWAGELLAAAACPNFCLQRDEKRFSVLQPLGGTILLVP